MSATRVFAVALRALKLGAAYGVRVRAPHTAVMTLLFGKPMSPVAFATRVAGAAVEHGKALAYFACIYKLAVGVLMLLGRKFGSGQAQWHSALAGGLGGYLVWAKYSHLNYQIVLYLLSRVIVACAKLIAKQGVQPFAAIPFERAYPYMATIVWALVMYLYEVHPGTLHPSLLTSMHEIYREADRAVATAIDYFPTPATVAAFAQLAMSASTWSDVVALFALPV